MLTYILQISQKKVLGFIFFKYEKAMNRPFWNEKEKKLAKKLFH